MLSPLVYEVILQQFDFKSYILRDGHDRADSSFVYQNKEGIFGLVGNHMENIVANCICLRDLSIFI